MYKRYYDGYGRVRKDADAGEIIVPHSSGDTYNNEPDAESAHSKELTSAGEISLSDACNKNIIFGLELDDLILVGVLIFLLINNDGDDPLMPIIIGIILIGEIL